VTARRLREDWWEDPTYDVSFVLVVCDRAQLNEWLKAKFGAEYQVGDADQHPRATTCFIANAKGSAVIFWFRPDGEPTSPRWAATFAHEAFHAAVAVMSSRGVRLTAGSEEAWAYYVGWVAGELRTRLARMPGWKARSRP
jgi:hypothetical protein